MKLNKFLLLVLVLTTFAGNMFADRVRIAVVAPITGPYAAFGKQVWRGALQAARDINAKEGVHGMFVELIQEDDQCQPDKASAIAEGLTDQQQVSAVIGHFCSDATIAAAPIYAKAGMLMITPASTAPAITQHSFSTVFRMCGRDDQQAKIPGNFLANKLNSQRVAIIHERNLYGQGLAEQVLGLLHQHDRKPVLLKEITRGTKDFASLVNEIKDNQADAVFFAGMHPEAGALARELHLQKSQIPFLTGDAIVSQDYLRITGGKDYAAATMMSFGPDPRNIESAKSIIESLLRHGVEPDGYTLYAYAATQTIVTAMKETGSFNPPQLAKWLHNNKVETVLGKKSWDSNGDINDSRYVMYIWNNHGKYNEIRDPRA